MRKSRTPAGFVLKPCKTVARKTLETSPTKRTILKDSKTSKPCETAARKMPKRCFWNPLTKNKAKPKKKVRGERMRKSSAQTPTTSRLQRMRKSSAQTPTTSRLLGALPLCEGSADIHPRWLFGISSIMPMIPIPPSTVFSFFLRLQTGASIQAEVHEKQWLMAFMNTQLKQGLPSLKLSLAPENRPPQKESSLLIIHFQVLG